jgi:hypothetical protein
VAYFLPKSLLLLLSSVLIYDFYAWFYPRPKSSFGFGEHKSMTSKAIAFSCIKIDSKSCSPNEDFGRMNKRCNADLRSTFQGREYSIGPQTIEKSIENQHFIFCSSFQNLRLGGVQMVQFVTFSGIVLPKSLLLLLSIVHVYFSCNSRPRPESATFCSAQLANSTSTTFHIFASTFCALQTKISEGRTNRQLSTHVLEKCVESIFNPAWESLGNVVYHMVGTPLREVTTLCAVFTCQPSEPKCVNHWH